MWKILICFFACAALGKALECLNGAIIYEHGMSVDDQKYMEGLHNALRNKIMDGTVIGQPRGRGLKTMIYDPDLQAVAANLTNTCQYKLKSGKDPRWDWIGLNIFVQYSSWKELRPNWNSAFKTWASQMKNFDYDLYVEEEKPHSAYAYTQIVWDKTDHLGCYYTFYYDKSRDDTPYVKLYACYYGVGGNILYRAPYKKYRNETTSKSDTLIKDNSVILDDN